MKHFKGLAAGAALGLAGGGYALAKRRGFNLRGWALFRLARMMAPNLSDPAELRSLIAEDRRKGPALPPAGMSGRFDFKDVVEDGLRCFHVTRRGGAGGGLKLLYLHGGAYVLDLQAIQWKLVDGLLERIDAEVVAPIYPLAPEAKWQRTTAAIRTFYLGLVERHGADNVVVVGDSAGGGLALLLAQSMRDEGGPLPKALVLYSPALDLSGSGPDQPALEKRDPALSLSLLHDIGSMWLDGLPATDPRVSPLFADQHGLPPTIVFTGDREILHSDALRLKAINPAVDHRSYPEMMHVFPVSPLREARQALDETADFIARALDGSRGSAC